MHSRNPYNSTIDWTELYVVNLGCDINEGSFSPMPVDGRYWEQQRPATPKSTVRMVTQRSGYLLDALGGFISHSHGVYNSSTTAYLRQMALWRQGHISTGTMVS